MSAEVTSPQALESSITDMCRRFEAAVTSVLGHDMAEDPAPRELWEACLGVALKDAVIRVRPVDASHPGLPEYEEHVGRVESPDELAGHRWLAIRKGARDGVLAIDVEVPRAAFGDQIVARAAGLGLDGDTASKQAELVAMLAESIPPALTASLDARATEDAIETACIAYKSLLLTPPVTDKRVGVLYPSSAKDEVMAITLTQRKHLLDETTFPATVESKPDVARWVESNRLTTIALPQGGVAPHKLALLKALLPDRVQVVNVRTAGLSESRRVSFHNPKARRVGTRSAVVIGLRAIDPMREFGKADPVSLGLAPYQSLIDDEALREALLDAKEEAKEDKHRQETEGIRKGQIDLRRRSGKASKINPLIKTWEDLRPGMMLDGEVANISKFGAFVDIGLPTHGLVHISELSDDYIRDPSEIVAIGQLVRVRILAVDRARARISLSMREGTSGRARAKAESGARTKALQDLENLFKK